jgi:ABC-type antimicrobial peptide transport system permease subunit
MRLNARRRVRRTHVVFPILTLNVAPTTSNEKKKRENENDIIRQNLPR